MPSRPTFSIIIPTRNRAPLLRHALQSALDLRSADLEVVLSDDGPTDDTREVVEERRDSRVRYVRTPRRFAISENIQFALESARGEYVALLCDDNAWVPGLLEGAQEILEGTRARLLAWPVCEYYYPDWWDIRYRNTLVAPPYSGRTREIQASHAVATLSRDFSVASLPRLVNTLCHRDLIERVERRIPRVSPLMLNSDIFAGIVLATEAGAYWWADTPFTVMGRCRQGIGASIAARRGTAWRAYQQEFVEEVTYRRVPFKTPMETNGCAEGLLEAKAVFGAPLDRVELDWERYFVRSFRLLLNQWLAGEDIAGDIAGLRAALATQPDAVRRTATEAIEQLDRRHRRSWRGQARRLINGAPVLRWLESMVRPTLKSHDGGVVLRGRQAGFRNILECARIWGRLLPGCRATGSAVSAAEGPAL